MNARERLLMAGEGHEIEWETIARECLEQMSVDECQDVIDAFDIDYQDDDDLPGEYN